MKARATVRAGLMLAIAISFFQSEKAISQDIEHLKLNNKVSLHGNLNLQLEYYHASEIDPRKKEFSWLINGNPTLNLFGIQVPFSFLFSNFENKFYQPFNQFGISPYYRWVKLHLGYRNITYSPYTLAGHTMLGAGFDLTPGKFRVGFMYGRLRRSTSVDSSMYANPQLERPVPAYKRLGYAMKVGYGTSKNYIDLIYFKGWDSEKSLSNSLKDSVQPAENKTVGLSGQVMLGKRLAWKTDIGFSAYTTNSDDSKDTTDTDKENKWIKSIMNPLVTDKISTRYYFAGETKLSYQMKKWTSELMYKRIDPGYQSMGAYFFQSDLREILFVNKFKLDSGKLNINTSIGFQKDNLKKLKTSTAKRFIGSANISYVPTLHFGINFNYNNYGITNNPLATSQGNESFKQVSNSVTLMPFFNWMNERSVKNLNFVLAYQSLSTPESSLGSVPDLNTYSVTAGYNHSWLKQGLSGNGALNYILSKTPQGDLESVGGTIGAGIPMMKRKVHLNTMLSYLSNKFDKKPNGNTFRGSLGAMVPVGTHHNFQLMINYLKNKAINTSVVENFSETSVQFIYGLTF